MQIRKATPWSFAFAVMLLGLYACSPLVDKSSCKGDNSCIDNSGGPTGPSGGGDNPDTTSKALSFVGLGFSPSDTTIILNTRYDLNGFIIVPVGRVTDLMVVSAFKCSAYQTPVVTATTTPNKYHVAITVQGIATCRDSIVISFKADTTVKTFVHVTVVSAAPPTGPTITVTPPGGSGPKGTTTQATCTITGVSDTRCRWYSTDPSRIAVVATDTTFSVSTAPWGTGAKKGGLIYFAFVGSANVCAYWVVDPRVAKCYLWVTTATP